MPTPPPTVGPPVNNPDGTTSQTTTTYHNNGSTKEKQTETRNADGDVVEETTDEFHKGSGPGDPNKGPQTKSTNRKWDDEGRLDEETETEYDRDGDKKEGEGVRYERQEHLASSTRSFR